MICFMHMNANKSTQQMVRRVTSRFVASKHLKAQLAIEFREDPTAVLPGSLTFSSKSSMLSTSCSLGEWSTTTVDPNTHIALPTFPSRLSRSCKNRDDKTSLKWKQTWWIYKMLKKLYKTKSHVSNYPKTNLNAPNINKHYFHWHAIGFCFCFCFLSIFQYFNYILFCSSLQWSGKENILHGYCNDILNRYMPWDDLKFW